MADRPGETENHGTEATAAADYDVHTATGTPAQLRHLRASASASAATSATSPVAAIACDVDDPDAVAFRRPASPSPPAPHDSTPPRATARATPHNAANVNIPVPIPILADPNTRPRTLRLLLWKNLTIKRRRPVATLVELLVPLALFVLLAWVRGRPALSRTEPDTLYPAQALPSAGALAFTRSMVCGIDLSRADSPPSVIDVVVQELERNDLLSKLQLPGTDDPDQVAVFCDLLGTVAGSSFGLPELEALAKQLSGGNAALETELELALLAAYAQPVVQNFVNLARAGNASTDELLARFLCPWTPELAKALAPVTEASIGSGINAYATNVPAGFIGYSLQDRLGALVHLLEPHIGYWPSTPTTDRMMHNISQTIVDLRKPLELLLCVYDSLGGTQRLEFEDGCAQVNSDNFIAKVTCPFGTTINVTFADFGLPSTRTCGHFASDPACTSLEAADIIRNTCQDKTSCLLSALEGALGGDPCPDNGATKTSALQYTCVPLPPPPRNLSAAPDGLYLVQNSASDPGLRPNLDDPSALAAAANDLCKELDFAPDSGSATLRLANASELAWIQQAFGGAYTPLCKPAQAHGVDRNASPANPSSSRQCLSVSCSGSRLAGDAAAMWEHRLGSGWQANFRTGDYDQARFVKAGGRLWEASSLFVPPNCRALLFEGNLDGRAYPFEAGRYQFYGEPVALYQNSAPNNDINSLSVRCRGDPDYDTFFKKSSPQSTGFTVAYLNLDEMRADTSYGFLTQSVEFQALPNGSSTLTSATPRIVIHVAEDLVPKSTTVTLDAYTLFDRAPWLKYWYSGFVMVQDMVVREVVRWRRENASSDDVYTTTSSSSPPSPNIDTPAFVQHYPDPAHLSETFEVAISNVLPLFLTLAFLPTVCLLAGAICLEKERGLKEAMKLMGVPNLQHWLGWWLSSMLLLTATVLVLSIILVAGKIFAYSSWLLIFLLLEFFAIATVSEAFLMSACFSRAKLATACAGILYFCSFVPFLFIQMRADNMGGGAKRAASLLPPTALGLGAEIVVHYEQQRVGLQWHNLASGAACDGFSVLSCMGMLLLDALIFALLSLYIEAVWPGPYGLPRPPQFPLTKAFWLQLWHDLCSWVAEQSCWSRSTTASGLSRGTGTGTGAAVGVPVKLEELCKSFDNGVTALNRLSTDFLPGQITALLGPNGAGKTTAMSILVGTIPFGSGRVRVGAHELPQDLRRIRQMIGLCPQHNYWFDGLTVYEHVWLAGRVRGMPASCAAEHTASLLSEVGLLEKRDAAVKTLSGGMKRKLTLAIALAGQPQVVICDEPTASLDPTARRAIWDILLRERGKGRTIVLTSHHMDEVETLASHITIMVRGQVQCAGTPMQLKALHGQGYVLELVGAGGVRGGAWAEQTAAAVKTRVPGAEVVERQAAVQRESAAASEQRLVMQVPDGNAAGLAALLRWIGDPANGVQRFALNEPTLEDIFIALTGGDEDNEHAAGRQEQEEAEGGEVAEEDDDPLLMYDGSSGSMGRKGEHEDGGEEEPNNDGGGDSGADADADEGDDRTALVRSSPPSTPTPTPTPTTFEPTPRRHIVQGLQRLRGLISRRLVLAWRKPVSFLCHVVCPVVFLVLAMAVSWKMPSDSSNDYALLLDPKVYTEACLPTATGDSLTLDADAVNAPPLGAYLRRVFAPQSSPVAISELGPTANLSSMLLELLPEDAHPLGAQMQISANASMLRDHFLGLPASVAESNVGQLWFSPMTTHGLPVAVASWHNSWLATMKVPGLERIDVYSQPEAESDSGDAANFVSSGNSLTVAVFCILSNAFVSAGFVMFLIAERVSSSKHLQYLTGLSPLLYWIGHLLFDLLGYLLQAGLSVALFAAFGIAAYSGRNMAAVVVLLLLYGPAGTAFVYPFSLVFKVPSSGYVAMISIGSMLGVVSTLSIYILNLFPDDPVLSEVSKGLSWIYLLLPQYCLGRSLLVLAENEYEAELSAVPGISSGRPWINPLHFDQTGKYLLALAVDTFVYLILVVLIDARRLRHVRKRRAQPRDAKQEREEEEGVQEEEKEEEEDEEEDDVPLLGSEAAGVGRAPGGGEGHLPAVEVDGLYKRFRKLKAVDGLSFEVEAGECFGLLGANGAGKTTTFDMLTGKSGPNKGRIVLRGKAAGKRPVIGFCPQVDALHFDLTGRETLCFFARLQGYGEADVERAVACALGVMQLERYADRAAGTYSGGNKRKLSMAVALLAPDISVLFLDEPTAGVDPVARRFLWRSLLRQRSLGCACVLTSHTIGDAAMLCDRVGIMVRGRFVAIGRPDELRQRFTDGYLIHVQLGASEAPGAPVGRAADEEENGEEDDNNSELAALAEVLQTAAERGEGVVVDKDQQVELVSVYNGHAEYRFGGNVTAPQLAAVVDALEGLQTAGRVVGFSLTKSSLEATFRRLVAEEGEDGREVTESEGGEGAGAGGQAAAGLEDVVVAMHGGGEADADGNASTTTWQQADTGASPRGMIQRVRERIAGLTGSQRLQRSRYDGDGASRPLFLRDENDSDDDLEL